MITCYHFHSDTSESYYFVLLPFKVIGNMQVPQRWKLLTVRLSGTGKNFGGQVKFFGTFPGPIAVLLDLYNRRSTAAAGFYGQH